jgi:hypothetical protein
MKRQHRIASVVLASALAATPALAAGPRYNGFAGQFCLLAADNAAVTVDLQGVADQAGPIETLHLACPLTMSVGGKRSLTTKSFLGASGSKCDQSADQPFVAVIDQHATRDISCTLYVLDQGNAVAASFTVTSVGNMAIKQTLSFAMPRMDFTNRALFAQCVVPSPYEPDRFTALPSKIVSFGVNSCDL